MHSVSSTFLLPLAHSSGLANNFLICIQIRTLDSLIHFGDWDVRMHACTLCDLLCVGSYNIIYYPRTDSSSSSPPLSNRGIIYSFNTLPNPFSHMPVSMSQLSTHSRWPGPRNHIVHTYIYIYIAIRWHPLCVHVVYLPVPSTLSTGYNTMPHFNLYRHCRASSALHVSVASEFVFISHPGSGVDIINTMALPSESGTWITRILE